MKDHKMRSCDRCHSIKGRCTWTEGSVECARCSRLGLSCTNTRPTKKNGRRPIGLGLARNHANLSHFGINEPDHLIYSIIDNFDLFGNLLVGPTFWKRHHESLTSRFQVSKSFFRDSYLACALTWAPSPGNLVADEDDACFQHASFGLQRLRQMEVTTVQEASNCLVLGAMMLLFSTWKRCSDAQIICRQTLSLIKPVYDNIDFDPEEFFFLTSMVLFEAMDCLVSGLAPTLKYRPKSGAYVDRYTGLYTPLLPHLYQLCELNSMLSRDKDNEDTFNHVLNMLDAIEPVVLAWQPSIPQGLWTDFTAIEVTHMFCQVQVMRLCALLIIYRLRYPFTIALYNGPARTLAMSILTQLSTISQAIGKGVKLVFLPVLVACFELQDQSERSHWLAQIPILLCCSGHFAVFIQHLIRSFWVARDSDTPIYGYNISSFL